ncbi:methylenetetrahydrofolate reductase [Lactobacillus sp. UCMA15818]|uniref:methylenetetrahydrofolate reductase n=1 Tax=Lactobacillus sp. UCMA15818 TaxID=2583394 RepID=UPI0025B1F607|nr:methylenetetrahydrofolate reductase [Lactobacillus sp. UCMA15818]MDN2452429.1 hypothetical protein [Lactobacillus sp. UCMA15818]
MATFNYSLELLQSIPDSKIMALKKLTPEFISIAYTNHTRSFFETTFSTAASFKKMTNIKTVIHLPASSFTQKELYKLLTELKKDVIDSALVLSGDQKIAKNAVLPSALGLAQFLHNELPHFKILCSCHPETAASNVTLEREISLMKAKEAAGCKIFISQIFFDTQLFIQFVHHCRNAGIKAQIRAGIMVITNKTQLAFVKKILQLPSSFKQISNNTELKKIGIQFAVNQVNQLKNEGLIDFHFFTINDLETVQILIDGVL